MITKQDTITIAYHHLDGIKRFYYNKRLVGIATKIDDEHYFSFANDSAGSFLSARILQMIVEKLNELNKKK